MAVNDPVGDLLTRIRNATLARHDKLSLPSSKLKVEVVRCLKDEGFVADFVVHERKPQDELTVMLKYGPNRESVISGIRRVSKPGLRRYVSVDKLPRVRGGTGISILSTSKGVLSDGEARKQNVGGELICTVY
ncbi:MAG: 30S ribosomal protein S8 [Myxococcaceae bacterium]|nr:30S ribosomal protein S8 [Myxococcaceae bacterium]MCA3013388.1 30S ribosomal protein S8 [Myxococcaceae bacterium]